jgi:hypothetical protein
LAALAKKKRHGAELPQHRTIYYGEQTLTVKAPD